MEQHRARLLAHTEEADHRKHMPDALLRVKTHTAHLFFVSEQKATGQQLLVARKMSGLHSELTLTFYKGVKTNMNDQFHNNVTRSVSSKALVPAQESENFG